MACVGDDDAWREKDKRLFLREALKENDDGKKINVSAL